jgi:hypothetical protein
LVQAITGKMEGCKRSRFQAPVIRQGQLETQTLNNVPNDVIRLSQTDASLLPRMRLFPCARLEVGIVYNGKSPYATHRGTLIYLLTAIGLSPGGSTHLHTNNTQNNTNKNRTTQIT